MFKRITYQLIAASAMAMALLFSGLPANADILNTSIAPGGGSIQGDSDFAFPAQVINCPAGSCSYDNFGAESSGDETVSLTATPDAGWFFVGWSGGGCSGTGACAVLLNPFGDPVTTFSVSAVFALIDSDQDGIADTSDLCPNTPANQAVNANGCSASQLDDDRDRVTNDIDQCPATPFGEAVDAVGCSASQTDSDSDDVSDDIDQCPDTPAGATVDANGCATSQLDSDEDGIFDDVDQCANTPAGEVANDVGCSTSQTDADDDGVADDVDQCPETPLEEDVDAVGCAASQLDDDGDGVNNDLDQCPDTGSGNDVDGDGCADDQKDSDGDGVNDAEDTCPNTDSEAMVSNDGCSEVQQFGNDLGELPGLSENEEALGSRIDEICPRLIDLDGDSSLSAGEKDLRNACSRLKNRDTTQDQAVTALGEISLTELASQARNAIEMASTQHRGLGKRISQMNSGGGGGVSVTGLNIRAGDQAVPAQLVQSAFQDLLGMGASGDNFVDFGKLGIFVQGDLDFGDRDETALESGYDFDAWNFSLGADYRISDTFYAGASLGFGEVDVDFGNNGGTSDISNWTLSTYGGWQINDNWYLDGLVSYGQSDYDTSRNIDYVDVGGRFTSSQDGDTDGDQFFLGLNSGYMFNKNAWRFGPIGSLAYLDGSIDGYSETSSGDSSEAWNFIVDNQDFKSLRLSAGVQADYAISTGFGVLVPGVRVVWVYETEDGAETIALRLANNPFGESDLESNQITVSTDGRDDNFLDASLNLSGQFVMGFSGYMSYQFYSAFDGYSQDGYSIGLRWDKPF